MACTELGIEKGMIFGRKKEHEFKMWHGILLVGILITAIILGVLQRMNSSEEDIPQNISVILNEETCQVSGGVWNACGSACRGMDDAIPCIEVCVNYCECLSDNQCPFDYSCVEKIDGIGICQQDESI